MATRKKVSSKNSYGYNNKKNKDSITKTYNSHNTTKNTNTNSLYLLPIALIVIILPLIVRLYNYETPLAQFPWFSTTSSYIDFFLFYKQWFFIGICFVIIIILYFKTKANKYFFQFLPIFIPLGIYAALALLSSLFSRYRDISFSGGFAQFESVLVLLGYCLITYYVYLVVQNEDDVKLVILYIVIGSLILGVIGLTQYFGHDFFGTSLGLKLITPRIYWNDLDQITSTVEKSRVYGTLYNPNYMGVYTALILPILILLTFFSRKIWQIILFISTIIILTICLIGSKSTAGLISIAIAMFLALILSWRYLVKYFYLAVPILLFIVLSLVLFNKKSDNYLVNQFKESTNFTKTEATLTDIQTNVEEVLIEYRGKTIKAKLFFDSSGALTIDIRDDNGGMIPLLTDQATGKLRLQDEHYDGFLFNPVMFENKIALSVTIDGHDWIFTNQTEDGTYYFINQYGKLDKIVEAPSSLFTGYESYASGRGYIWSRSIPLLKDNFILGSGADTFPIEFPQQDYVNLYNNGYGNQILTKPHNLYLQIGVQTGALSLLAFIIFYGIYFISSFTLYINNKFDSFYSKIGVSILVGTFAYMIAGIANDSSITVAPMYWVLMGLGISVNSKVKSLSH